MPAKGRAIARLAKRVEQLRSKLKAAEEQIRALRESSQEAEAKVCSERTVLARAEAACRAKEEFMAELSHEMRTPLSPVMLAASDLERREDLPPEVREQAGMMRRNVELAARLVSDLLDLTRITRGKLEMQWQVLDVCHVLHETAAMCAGDIAAKQQRLSLEVERGKHFVRGDLNRLQQVFANLLTNSIKFTPRGGVIELRCEQREPGRVSLELADNGMGIAPEILQRLFEPFQQGGRDVVRRHGGLGLGLYISRSLVEMHGGSIRARSDGLGKGAAFTVELPLCQNTVCPVPSDDATPALALSTHDSQLSTPDAALTTSLRVLLVEDHADSARTLARLLRSFGHTVTIADSVTMARILAEAHRFDLLVSDLGLPDGSGADLMRDLRQKQELTGIAVSGYGTPKDIEESKTAGFLEHVVKPLSLSSLEEVLNRATRAVLEGRRQKSQVSDQKSEELMIE